MEMPSKEVVQITKLRKIFWALFHQFALYFLFIPKRRACFN